MNLLGGIQYEIVGYSAYEKKIYIIAVACRF